MDTEKSHMTSSFGQRIKYTFMVVNFIFFIAGFIILGVGIWVALERNEVSIVFEIVGQQDKIRAPVILATVASALVGLIAYVGGYGAYKEKKLLIITYVVSAIGICLTVLVAAILALVYRSQVDNRVRDVMQKTITSQYGTDTHITGTWDYAQISLYCCGVEDASWRVYSDSPWYFQQEGTLEERPLVPSSCCVRDHDGDLLNPEECQRNRAGPPARTGGENLALQFRGCFNVAYERTHRYALAIAVTGFMLAICMIIGVVIGALLLSAMARSEKGKSDNK